MNEILQGSQNKLPTARTSTLGPLVQGPRHSSVKPSLNRRLREKSDLRIQEENENILKRLQEQSSNYNVYDWEIDRRGQINRIKQICYYKPSLIGKKSARRSHRGSEYSEPNRQLFDLYQKSIREGSQDPLMIESSQPDTFQLPQISAQEPPQTSRDAFATQNNKFVTVQDFDSYGQRKPCKTSNGAREKSTDRLTSVKKGRGLTSADSSQQKQSVNIIAKKRPPPLSIGYNELGIKDKRAVLYRNFHEISARVYLLEISRSKKKIFILLFENFEQPTKFIGEAFSEKLATKLMNDNDNQFETLVRKFSIKFGKLQIEGYHTKGPLQSGVPRSQSRCRIQSGKKPLDQVTGSFDAENPYKIANQRHDSESPDSVVGDDLLAQEFIVNASKIPDRPQSQQAQSPLRSLAEQQPLTVVATSITSQQRSQPNIESETPIVRQGSNQPSSQTDTSKSTVKTIKATAPINIDDYELE